MLELGDTLNQGYAFALIAGDCYIRDVAPGAICRPLPRGVEAAVDRLAKGEFRSDEQALARLSDGECIFVARLDAGGARFGVFAPMEESAPLSPEVELVRQLYPVFTEKP